MRWSVPVLVMMLLAGCGANGTASDRVADIRAKEQASAAAPSGASSGAPKASTGSAGDAAPEALSAFRCQKGAKDAWAAAGFLKNDATTAVSYQVTVYVGPVDGASRSASTQRVANVKAGGSTRFQIDDIAADGDQCHVQVLRLSS